MKKRVNVIVPVYNSEGLIGKCIESILGQTYKDLTLICIDDGSKDKTLSVVQSYAEKDNRLTVIHKDNGGVGSARNTGLDAVDYDEDSYIMFVDADDYLEGNYIAAMVEKIEADGSDIIVTNATVLSEKGEELAGLKERLDRDCTLGGFQATKEIILCGMTPACIAKLFRSSLLKNERLIDSLYVGEDTEFTYRVFSKAKQVSILHCPGYMVNRFSDLSSLTRQEWNKRKILSCLRCDRLRAQYKIDTFSDTENRELTKIIQDDVADGFLELYPRLKLKELTKEEREEIKAYVKFLLKSGIIKNYRSPIRNVRIKRFLFLYFRPLYRLIYKIVLSAEKK